jgi:hypothetical protein
MPPQARDPSAVPSRRPGTASGARRVGQRRYRRPSRTSAAVWAIPLVGLALVAVVAVALVRPHRGGGSAGQPVPAAVLAALTQIPQATWDAVGGTGAKPLTGIPASDRPASAPTLLYVGAEYCPYCAAARWSLVAALARFGTWQGLELASSSPRDYYPGTPTFTFVHATYRSQYLPDVQTVEVQGSAPDVPLQTLSPAQAALQAKYDAPPYVPGNAGGGIPFILVGGRYMWSGSPFSPGLLSGKDWSTIAGALAAGRTDFAKAILANANELAAALCAVDGGQPASVCDSPGVRAAAAVLPAAGAA